MNRVVGRTSDKHAEQEEEQVLGARFIVWLPKAR
jgi:hypothetical protein